MRWPLIALWLAITAATLLWLPQLSVVVAHTPTNYLPNSANVMQGTTLLSQIDPSQASQSTAVLAIRDKQGLTAADKQYFSHVLGNIETHKQSYGVKQVQDLQNTNAKLASSFVSKDQTTEIALIGFPGGELSDATKTALANVHQAFSSPPPGSNIYVTGEAPIQQDDIAISQAGVSKTVKVTVVLVLLILLLVLRSLMAPLVTLLAIGLSFLISSGVVAWLAQHGLPVSNFTQTFLVAVLFGAGTDYSIIILTRFREELSREHGDKRIALADTLRSVLKTVAFSSSTVIVSFAVLGFAHFGLYKSAVGVAVGVAITLITCMVFVPALLSVFGGGLYWPWRPRPGMGHRPSRIWSWTGGLATRRPWWVILALLVVLAPIALLFTNQRTFNPLNDIPGAPSAKGFQVVSNAFGPGNALPMQIVLKSPDNLRTAASLTTVEHIPMPWLPIRRSLRSTAPRVLPGRPSNNSSWPRKTSRRHQGSARCSLVWRRWQTRCRGMVACPRRGAARAH